jgi:hypothetical protein
MTPAQAVGVSAVKALAIAEQQGQKIYSISQSNVSQLANVNESPTVMSDISNALSAGMEVVVHEAPISTSGFSGGGYIITDPGTGAGSYLIEAGSHGAKIAKGHISGGHCAAVLSSKCLGGSEWVTCVVRFYFHFCRLLLSATKCDRDT